MTKKGSDPKRHLSWETLKARIAVGTPSRDVISGVPRVVLDVEEGGQRLALRLYGPAPSNEQLPTFSSLICARVGKGKESHILISCVQPEFFADFYPFLVNIADRVQLESQAAHEAISDAADSLRALLAGASLLSQEKQLGLWGELWLLQQLAERTNWTAALAAWTLAAADTSEEHDFVLADHDVEVKTTISEKRQHHISSATQLEPKPGRELLVLSLQITPAAGAQGDSIHSMVEIARSGASASSRKRLDAGLKRAGWSETHAQSYRSRWILRTTPAFVSASELPRLRATGPGPERIVSFSYVVDLTDLARSSNKEWSWLK